MIDVMSADRDAVSGPAPFELVPGLLDPDTVAWMQQLVAVAYGRPELADSSAAPLSAETPLSPRGRFVVTASSMSLDAVLADADIDRLREAFARGAVRTAAAGLPSDPLVLDVDRSWLRRQFPLHDAPRFHAPHGWHQDGALGYDFSAAGDDTPREGLLDMVTCWIALVPCGHDAAGLEFVDDTLRELLPVDALVDAAVRQRFSAGRFCTPVMAAGDAMVFPSGTLHRTHVTERMSRVRTSLELRLFAEDRLPQRLGGDRFVPWLARGRTDSST